MSTNDTISRQQAINAIHEDADWLASQGSDWQVERMERDKSILCSLPSTQPEIILCKDCRYAVKYNICAYVAWCNRADDFCSRAERREG